MILWKQNYYSVLVGFILITSIIGTIRFLVLNNPENGNGSSEKLEFNNDSNNQLPNDNNHSINNPPLNPFLNANTTVIIKEVLILWKLIYGEILCQGFIVVMVEH